MGGRKTAVGRKVRPLVASTNTECGKGRESMSVGSGGRSDKKVKNRLAFID